MRLYRPYGPGQLNRLIPKLADRICQGQTIQLSKEDRPFQTPIFVEDVVTAFERSLEATFAGPVTIAGDRVISMRELAEAIGRILGLKPVFEQTRSETGDMIGDNTCMKKVLGSWPLVDLAEGLARTLKN